jgi:hypothetical protein
MGGPGSGRTPKIRRDYTDEFKQFDVRNLAKCLTLEVKNKQLSLQSYKDKPFAWPQASLSIALAYTPCNFGGKQVWFVCPLCSKRVAILYEGPKSLSCRTCNRLKYRSQYMQSPSCIINNLMSPWFRRSTLTQLQRKYAKRKQFSASS